MKYIIAILFLLVLFACKEEQKAEVVIPVIYLNPDEAGEMKTTDYFDNYEVVALKGVVCRGVQDVIEYPDRWIALLYEGADKHFLYAYDKMGNPLCPLGMLGRGPGEYITAGKEICLDRDSAIVVDILAKSMKFGIEGELLDEKICEDRFGLKYGTPVYFLNDSTLLYHNKGFYAYSGPTPKMKAEYMKWIKGKHLLNVVPTRPGREVLSYWDAEDLYLYQLSDPMYIFQDTCCFYIEKAGEVYSVSEKGIVPRYRVDRGKHPDFLTKEELVANVVTGKIRMMSMEEIEKYVLGIYLFDEHYYIFIYDKATQQTHNYKTVDDDLLKVRAKKNDFFPFAYLKYWIGRRHFNQNGAIFLLGPDQFAHMIEYIRKKMSNEEWKQYCDEHSDLIRVYDELENDTYGVVLKYKYK